MSLLQFRFSGMQLFGFRFSPSSIGILITAICITLFIKFGFWQYNKAEQKQALQTKFDRYLNSAPIDLPDHFSNQENWRYRKVKAIGKYDTQYQILLDNQLENEVAGYHVITPFRVKGTTQIILVDRGWIPASATHSILPLVNTPKGDQEVVGHLWLPTTKIFSLESKQSSKGVQNVWNSLWQHMDMAKYSAAVPFKIMPLIIRLDEASNAGGFKRHWVRPAERITTHIGYAYQWFGFAVAAFIIFVFVNTKKLETSKS